MRIFWAVIGVLILATVGVLVWSRPGRPAEQPAGSARPPSPVAGAAAQPSPSSRPSSSPVPASEPVPVQEAAPAAPDHSIDAPAVPQPSVPAVPPAAVETVPAPAEPAVEPHTPESPLVNGPAEETQQATVLPPLEPVPLPTLNELLGLPDLVTSSRRPQSTEAPAAGPAAPIDDSPAASAAAMLLPQDDGSTLVDSRFTLRGNGEKGSPFEVTWDMLLSAQETYQPRLGKKVIPDRLKMLDGKWVKITGYVAFPIMASSADEMLVMLNQWDGCCIGVPPTPYDAVEVRLGKAVEGEGRLMTSGVVTGRLKVDPFLVRDWLVSLYMMEDAAVIAD